MEIKNRRCQNYCTTCEQMLKEGATMFQCMQQCIGGKGWKWRMRVGMESQ